MIDLNHGPPQQIERYDLDDLTRRLAAEAETWVPRLFPHGRREGDTWRLADIGGGAPGKHGSCEIGLKGEYAGWFTDWETGERGGPLTTLARATKLTGGALYDQAAEMGGVPVITAGPEARPARKGDKEIAFILAHAVPLAGTPAATYLAQRGLSVPASPDLLFNASVTYWETRTGHPAMVAIVRDGGGAPMAIHRTWLAADGLGKAAVAKPRMMLGPVASGCVRLAEPAGDILALCEGIETGLAVLQSCPGLAVWAALSAGNMEKADLPAEIKRVILLADHDQSGTGLAAAERTARRHQAVGRQVWIALPPREGDDFNDLLLKDGPQAVRETVEAAWEPETPDAQSPADGPPEDDGAAVREDVARIAVQYPLPRLDTLSLRYRPTRTGVVKVHRFCGKDKQGRERWLPIATPFGVPARLRYIDQDDAYGLRVLVQDMADAPRPVDFPRAGLARTGAADIRAALFAAGLRTEADGDHVAVAVLKAADPKGEIAVLSRPGLHQVPGLVDPIFITPDGEVIGAPEGCGLELAVSARIGTGERAGSMDGWAQAVQAAAQAPDCPHWILGIAAGFAGPILALAGLDSGGINLSGLSSSGKSTAQRLAVSAWTSPTVGAGLLQSMRSTENALEVLAQASSGTILALDEMAHADGRTIARMIYAIAGGQGKARLTAGATLKGRYQWTTFALLSGECSLEEKVRGDGGTWLAGMAVRIVDVDVTAVNRAVDEATLQAVAEITHHHGHAGPAFMRALVAAGLHRRPDTVRDQVLHAARQLAGPDADSARIRAATSLALPLVAGKMAQQFGCLSAAIDIAGAIEWAWSQFDGSSDAQALAPDEQAITNLRAWIAERWDVTVKSVDAAADGYDRQRLNNRETVGWYDHEAVYLPSHRLREAVGQVLKEQQVVKVLIECNLLARRHNTRRAAIRWIPKVGRLDCYALRRSEFGRSGRERLDLDLDADEGDQQ